MLPSSHLVPINRAVHDSGGQAAFLADAFSDFIGASTRLECSYRELQQEVAQLRLQLQDRDRVNEQMRVRLQHILESLPCGVLVTGKDHAVTLTNPEALRLLRMSSDSGLNLEQILTTGMDLAVGADVEQELPLTSGSETVWLAVRQQQLFFNSMPSGDHPQPQSDETIFILRDATAQRRFAEERETARKTIALAEMATVLAHEIRNPLASMELFAGLMVEEPRDTALWISHLRAGIRSLAATVNNVLRFYSAGAPNLAPVLVRKSLRGFVEFVRPIAEQRGVRVWLDDAAGDLEIAADENSMQQVFLNLALNAFRHTPSGGELYLRAEALAQCSEKRVRVTFADTGCGIAPHHLERIFEAGFSVDGHSVGLGLSVCRRVMEQMGGSLTVSSRLNVGTVFYLEFSAL